MPDEKRFLACGCLPYATVKRGGVMVPYCIHHDETRLADSEPSLEGRMAVCADCKRETPSSKDLAFFEYLGPGSEDALRSCICGAYDTAHEKPGFADQAKDSKCGGTFTLRGPLPKDRYYCGCRGWD